MTYLYLLAGLFLIYLEFFLPGWILGVLGATLVIISLFSYIANSLYVLGAILYFLGSIAAVALVIRFALWRIRTAPPEYSIYSNQDQEGYVASVFDKEAIGKEATVLSDLKPGGYVVIDGKQHQAISQEGYISKGSKVLVIAGQEESLIVTLTQTQESYKKDQRL